jgi:hypothetical protein
VLDSVVKSTPIVLLLQVLEETPPQRLDARANAIVTSDPPH